MKTSSLEKEIVSCRTFSKKGYVCDSLFMFLFLCFDHVIQTQYRILQYWNVRFHYFFETYKKNFNRFTKYIYVRSYLRYSKNWPLLTIQTNSFSLLINYSKYSVEKHCRNEVKKHFFCVLNVRLLLTEEMFWFIFIILF